LEFLGIKTSLRVGEIDGRGHRNTSKKNLAPLPKGAPEQDRWGGGGKKNGMLIPRGTESGALGETASRRSLLHQTKVDANKDHAVWG